MYIITGVDGNFGGKVAQEILKEVSGDQLISPVRPLNVSITPPLRVVNFRGSSFAPPTTMTMP
ncbi:hypothetical protein [Sodalis sp. dw_96]|uniref:hypothetical protein n=1 Tax=Sodalis sp. dw_96 TaxID=2719794 RepID=UPI001BD42833|nr:hypothetical protein [Sodalis sp. dw_96]